MGIAKGNGCGLLSETTQNILFRLSHKQLEESARKDTESDSKPPNVNVLLVRRGRCGCWNQLASQVSLRHRASRGNTTVFHNSIDADLKLTKANNPCCPWLSREQEKLFHILEQQFSS